MSSWRIIKTDVLEMSVSSERRRVDFLGDSSRRSRKFWIFSGIVTEWCQPLWPLWASATRSVSRNLSIKRWVVHCSCQNLSCIATMSEELICGKVRPDDFYPLLGSIASSWIHIAVKRTSQACYRHHLKNMEKNVKHNFGMKNKIGRFFWTTL